MNTIRSAAAIGDAADFLAALGELPPQRPPARTVVGAFRVPLMFRWRDSHRFRLRVKDSIADLIAAVQPRSVLVVLDAIDRRVVVGLPRLAQQLADQIGAEARTQLASAAGVAAITMRHPYERTLVAWRTRQFITSQATAAQGAVVNAQDLYDQRLREAMDAQTL